MVVVGGRGMVVVVVREERRRRREHNNATKVTRGPITCLTPTRVATSTPLSSTGKTPLATPTALPHTPPSAPPSPGLRDTPGEPARALASNAYPRRRTPTPFRRRRDANAAVTSRERKHGGAPNGRGGGTPTTLSHTSYFKRLRRRFGSLANNGNIGWRSCRTNNISNSNNNTTSSLDDVELHCR